MPEINSFLLRLFVLLLPGLLGSRVYRKLRGRSRKEVWEDFLEILLFSLLSYAITGFGFSLVAPASTAGPATTRPTALDAMFNEAAAVPWLEIVVATTVGVALAALASLAHYRKWIHKAGIFIGVTKRAADEDVWEQLHNQTCPPDEWFWVRDHKLGLGYFGWVDLFSESGEPRELVMRNVQVFDNQSGAVLYETPLMYIARESSDLTIELPPQPRENQHPAGVQDVRPAETSAPDQGERLSD